MELASFAHTLSLSIVFALAAPSASAVAADAAGVWLKHLRSQDQRERLIAAYRVESGAGNSDEAVNELLAALRDPAPFVRQHVAAVLGDFPGHGDEIIPALAVLLRDPAPEVCAQATVALAKRGQAAVPALIRALQDTRGIGTGLTIGRLEQTVASPSDYAAAALIRMGAPVFPSLADAYLATRNRYALRGLGAAAKPYNLPPFNLNGFPGRSEVLDFIGSVTRRFSPAYLREAIVHIMTNRPHGLDLPGAISYLRGVDPGDSRPGIVDSRDQVGDFRGRDRAANCGIPKIPG